MSLASLIREQMVTPVRCKTCILLEQMPQQDRDEFKAAGTQVPASILARALTARLHELGIDDAPAQGSVRVHIRDGHGE